MKKTYNTPTTFCVALRAVTMMATSEYSKTNVNDISRGTDGDYIETKGLSDNAIWDSEW